MADDTASMAKAIYFERLYRETKQANEELRERLRDLERFASVAPELEKLRIGVVRLLAHWNNP